MSSISDSLSSSTTAPAEIMSADKQQLLIGSSGGKGSSSWKSPLWMFGGMLAIVAIVPLAVFLVSFAMALAGPGFYTYVGMVGACCLALYLWLLHSGKTSFRVRSSQEAAAALPTRVIAAVAVALIVGGVLTVAGERGLRAAAAGVTADGVRADNAYSRQMAVVAPALLMVGVLNLLAAVSKQHLVVLVTGAANSLLSIAIYFYGMGFGGGDGESSSYSSRRYARSDEGYGYSYGYGYEDSNGSVGYGYSRSTHSSSGSVANPASLFTTSDTFLRDWVMSARDASHAASFPPQPLTTLHLLRAVPSYLCMFLPLAASVIIFRCLFHVSLVEGDEVATKTDKTKTTLCGFWTSLVLGLASLLVSVVLAGSLARLPVVTSVDHVAFSSVSATLVGLTTAVGLLCFTAAAARSQRTRSLLLALLLVLSVLTFVWAYRSLDLSDGVEARSAARRTLLSAGPAPKKCSEDKDDEEKQQGLTAVVTVFVNVDTSNDTEKASSTSSANNNSNDDQKTSDDDAKEEEREYDRSQSCYSVRPSSASCDGADDLIVCIPKDRVCDGVADLAAPALVCDGSYCGANVAFADEVDCAAAVAPSLGGGRAAAWAAMTLAVAVMVVVTAAISREDEQESGLWDSIPYFHKKKQQQSV